jgi:poly(A) polymerase Pap1
VESRLRFLILNLEQVVKYASPCPNSFQHNIAEDSRTIYCSDFFLGLTINITKIPGAPPQPIDLTPAVTDFVQTIKEWPQKTPTSDIKVRYVKK